MLLGCAMAAGRWPGYALLAVAVVLVTVRALAEERVLAADPDYRAYQDRVRGLLLPGIGLQVLLAVLVLKTAVGEAAMALANQAVTKLVEMSDVGAEFVFGETFKDHWVAFSIGSTIIFFSSVMTVLYHLGVLQWVEQFPKFGKQAVYLDDRYAPILNDALARSEDPGASYS